jgi:glycine/D-amino acid oxidase-like deaminating enzyme
MIRGSDDLMLDFHTIGYRPMPADGFPIVGALESRPGAYVAVTHSGVTLAPVIGLFATEEILTGRRDPLLRPYGLDRFA